MVKYENLYENDDDDDYDDCAGSNDRSCGAGSGVRVNSGQGGGCSGQGGGQGCCGGQGSHGGQGHHVGQGSHGDQGSLGIKDRSFLRIWHKYCKDIKIQGARSDLCDTCDKKLTSLRHSLLPSQRDRIKKSI